MFKGRGIKSNKGGREGGRKGCGKERGRGYLVTEKTVMCKIKLHSIKQIL